MKGFTTIHAGSARQALTRLRFICQLADTSTELPISALSALVSEAVDLVVHCTRSGPDVRVSEILAVEELQTGRDSVTFTLTELFARARPDDPLRWTGNLPVRAGRMLEAAGYDVRILLDPEARRPRAVSRTAAANGASAAPTRPRRTRPKATPPA